MSSCDQDSVSESCSPSSFESPYSSPSHQVPHLLNYSELNPGYNVHPDARGQVIPYLRIIEQPQNHFRFRYRSEMVGTHGCILGKTSSSNKTKTHPTVELVNFNKRAVIRCRLAQNDQDAEHPHQLLEDEQEDCDVKALVPEDNSYKVGFPGMGIIHTAKKDVPKLLFKKYSSEIRGNFPKKELMSRCEAEAKGINLNIVRLRFSAHDIETGLEICEPVFSEPIHNMKSAATNDLKICRTSRISGDPKGGDDVFILVEKVNKKNIEVRFVERNDEGNICWTAKAHFLLTDVHHQYAIVFRTPPYQNTKPTSDVKVSMELFRPTDGRSSDPIEFTYLLDPVARQAGRDHNGSSPFSSWNSPLGTESIKSLSDLPAPVSSMLTSENNMDIDDEMSGMPSAMPFVGSQATPVELHCSVGVSPMMPQVNSFPVISLNSGDFKHPTSTSVEMNEFSNFLQHYLRDSADYNSGILENPSGYNFSLVPDSGRGKVEPPSPTKSTQRSPSQIKSENISQNGVVEEPNKEYTAVFSPENGEEVKQLVKEICELIRNKSGIKKQVVRDKLERLFQLRLSNGDTFLHMTLFNNRSSFDYIVKLVYQMKMYHLLNLANNRGQTILHAAVIHNMPKLMAFLVPRGCDPTLGDQDGNSAIHLAVKYQSCLEPLLDAIKSRDGPCDLNVANRAKQTPLHLAAVPGPDADAAAWAVRAIALLLERGAGHTARDCEGRTPLHLAVYDDCLPVVRALLDHITPSDIDAVDGRSNTALQIACGGPLRDNTVAIVKLLLEKEASAALAWRLARDKPELRELLEPLVPGADDVKSEPEDEYESAEEGDETCLRELSLYGSELSRMLDASGAWRALARRLQHDALANWFENTPSPTKTLLNQVKECQDSSITSKTLILMLEELGQVEAARLIRTRIGLD